MQTSIKSWPCDLLYIDHYAFVQDNFPQEIYPILRVSTGTLFARARVCVSVDREREMLECIMYW